MRLMPALAALLACARSEPDGVAQCDDAGATNWTDAEWEAARAEGLALARRGAASVLYLHIFKAGGTSVCAAAVAAGFVTPPGDENCNVPAALGLLRDGAATPPALAARVRARAPPWGFVGIEHVGLPAGARAAWASPRCAVWATQLRDPRDRMLSHFYHAQVTGPALYGACALSLSLSGRRLRPARSPPAHRLADGASSTARRRSTTAA